MCLNQNNPSKPELHPYDCDILDTIRYYVMYHKIIRINIFVALQHSKSLDLEDIAHNYIKTDRGVSSCFTHRV